MSDNEESQAAFDQDHQAAYVFDPDGDVARAERPSKRRRVSKKASSARTKNVSASQSLFVPLMGRVEKKEAVAERERLYNDCWCKVELRIRRMLRDSNRATLDDVASFADEARTSCNDRIPSAFIITGPNLASQDLLFEQLEENLVVSTKSKFVKLKSSDATNLKATLKKIIRDITTKVSEDDDDAQVTVGKSGRKYLNYDLEAVEEFIVAQGGCEHVFVAFQDSEGFDSALLSELISLFSTWRGQIPFTLLFGVATSIELLQNRLRKSACEHLYGAQFDVAQGTMVLEQAIIKAAVAAMDVPLRIGPSLLQSLTGRQHDQVTGVQGFISSLKYAYMCHFYANPLSIFMSTDTSKEQQIWLQPEHLEGIRSLPSFRKHVEDAIEAGETNHARLLLDDDEYLLRCVKDSTADKAVWLSEVVRAVQILCALKVQGGGFADLFIHAMAGTTDVESDDSAVWTAIKKMDPEKMISAMKDVKRALGEELDGASPTYSRDNEKMRSALSDLIARSEDLLAAAEEDDHTLRSAYSGQTKVARTTVVAQRVQLSHDSAALTEADTAFTEVVDDLVELLRGATSCTGINDTFLHETWMYDSKAPYRDVFIPRPGAVIERGLTRPGDYLGCECCAGSDGTISAVTPPTAILYHLYLEAGGLINVADLWSAFYAVVAGEDAGEEAGEREALPLFYQGLAELRSLGFVKPSKKKTDHVAKVKWL